MYDFADKANASVRNFKELTAFLELVSAETIVNLTSQTSFDRTLIFDYAPVIESECIAANGWQFIFNISFPFLSSFLRNLLHV